MSKVKIYWIVIYIVKYKNTFMSEQGNIPILQKNSNHVIILLWV